MKDIGSTRQNLTDEVYALLKEQLLHRLYKPSQRLYVNEIAKKLGVSYTPVQQAFSKLAKEGLATSKPRKGTIVTSLSYKDIQEVFDIRLLLESYAAKLLCERNVPDMKNKLKRLSEEMSKLGKKNDKFPEFAKKDREFHFAIVKAAGNRKLCEIFLYVDSWMHIIRVYYMQTASQKRIDDSIREHQEICDSFQKGDAEGASKRIKSHIQTTEKAVLGGISKRKSSI